MFQDLDRRSGLLQQLLAGFRQPIRRVVRTKADDLYVLQQLEGIADRRRRDF